MQTINQTGYCSLGNFCSFINHFKLKIFSVFSFLGIFRDLLLEVLGCKVGGDDAAGAGDGLQQLLRRRWLLHLAARPLTPVQFGGGGG